jgi:hypothetical protein
MIEYTYWGKKINAYFTRMYGLNFNQLKKKILESLTPWISTNNRTRHFSSGHRHIGVGESNGLP